MRHVILGLLLCAGSAVADTLSDADVLFLGEVHDNPAHHARQAEIVAEVQPRAIVWEMLDPEAMPRITPDLIADEAALGAALNWADSGWPAFSMYYPIFVAAPEAAHFGAQVPRDAARAVMSQTLVEAFGENAARFGLDRPLPVGQQERREALQMAAHCDALPADILPMMVDIQRLRDARLAAAALEALEATGGPVAVITGNGHARKDWGAPALLALAAPDVSILALGQGENEGAAPDGGFDLIESAPPVDRPDPCEAFRAR
ncbi:ChaN family lipoprotein [Mameliella sp. AT18]|uniref:ChaN family lipoprotein n=1 Tax=Mameliella sp. AT18 TaxID=3028385 RepID=UPI0008410611|nr:ChaN family lipoprotein [Mameliella sp. AT18]MDD9729280.1 ChaN family lipoprotein [Mameliella sp. AT18]ODM50114.1 hypothetical protein A9320_12290 [Ruegeria sp. PBVC088]